MQSAQYVWPGAEQGLPKWHHLESKLKKKIQ